MVLWCVFCLFGGWLGVVSVLNLVCREVYVENRQLAPALQIDLIEKHKQRLVVVAVVAQASGCRLGLRCRQSDGWSES